MIQAILSIYFILAFFRDAKHSDKNPWIWALAGGLCFFLSSFAITQLVILTIAQSAKSTESAITVLVVGITVGLLSGFFITRGVQKKFLKGSQETVVGRDQPLAGDSPRLPAFENDSKVSCGSCRWAGTGEELHQKDENPGKFIYCPNCGSEVSAA